MYQLPRISTPALVADDIHRLVGTDSNSSSRTDNTENSFAMSSRLNSVEVKLIEGTKKTFAVSIVSFGDFDIDPLMRNKILALPAGGIFFDSIYEGNIKRLAMEVLYVLKEDHTKTCSLHHHVHLLAHLTSFVIFCYIDERDCKELALRMATGKPKKGDPSGPPGIAFMTEKMEVLIRDHPTFKRLVDVHPLTNKYIVVEASLTRLKEFIRRPLWDAIWTLRFNDVDKVPNFFKWLFVDSSLLRTMKVVFLDFI